MRQHILQIRGRICIDDFDNRFRLNQIEFVIEHGAPGELTRLGEAATGGTQLFENHVGREAATVTKDFNHIFTGVRIGGGITNEGDLIEARTIACREPEEMRMPR